VGVSADAPGTLVAFTKENNLHHQLLSDFPRRTMLTAYDAVITDPASPIFRYAKRAYFIVDRQGVIRYTKVQENPLELLKPEEVLQALKQSGAK
jgi:peroxiredoxin